MPPVGRAKTLKAAQLMLERHKIRQPPVDPFEIARREKVTVVTKRLPADTSSVLLRESTGDRIIAVNASHHPLRQRFSVAHELGHASLHFPARSPGIPEAAVSRPLEVLYRDGLAEEGTDQVEIEANSFAAALLMPRQLLEPAFRQLLCQSRPIRADKLVRQLADQFQVSQQAMSYRLINLGFIDPA